MPKQDIIVGLDIGSTKVSTIVGQKTEEGEVEIIGLGMVPSLGIRKGIVVNVEEVTSSISASLEEAERMAGLPLHSAYVAVGGSHLGCLTSRGVVATSRQGGEISEEDRRRVIEASSAISLPANCEILHIIPKSYIVDGEVGIKDPVGMNGIRVEVESLIIYGLSPTIKNLTQCINQTGLDIEGLVASPLASSKSILSPRQRELGVSLLEIGGGTCGLCVFEEDELLGLTILPVGSSHITNDLAIGLRTSIDLAERVKLEYGIANPQEVKGSEKIDLSRLEKTEEGEVSRQHIAEIIEARLSEIFHLARGELKKLGKDVMLPAGIVITGGGAKIAGIVELAKERLKLPAQIGFPSGFKGIIDKIDDPRYATSTGLVLWGFEEKEKGRFILPFKGKEIGSKIKKWFRSFLP